MTFPANANTAINYQRRLVPAMGFPRDNPDSHLDGWKLAPTLGISLKMKHDKICCSLFHDGTTLEMVVRNLIIQMGCLIQVVWSHRV